VQRCFERRDPRLSRTRASSVVVLHAEGQSGKTTQLCWSIRRMTFGRRAVAGSIEEVQRVSTP
jgi:hypothetical protein